MAWIAAVSPGCQQTKGRIAISGVDEDSALVIRSLVVCLATLDLFQKTGIERTAAHRQEFILRVDEGRLLSRGSSA